MVIQRQKALIGFLSALLFGILGLAGLFTDLENTISQKDYSKASEIAHGIKGMTGNLGMNILFEESSKLMVQMRSGAPDEQDLKNYRDAVIKTREYAEKVVAQLEQ